MEKYGTIPPRFTKEWWSYFWDYYKWHTLGSAFALVLIVTSAVQCATKTKYDMTLTYAGNSSFSDEFSENISSNLGEVIDDIDDNGQKNVFFQPLTFGQENADPQYEMAMQTKLSLEFSAGETYLFIFSKDVADNYLNSDSSEGLFLPLDEWITDNSLTDGVQLEMAGGKAYGVSLAESAYFKNLGLDMSQQYIVMRTPRDSELKDEKMSAQYENAKKAAEYLLAR